MATTNKTELEPIMKIRDVISGEYTIIEFEKCKTTYGHSYILKLIKDEADSFKMWSNSYVNDYIDTVNPIKKFTITIQDGLITIPGYCKKRL